MEKIDKDWIDSKLQIKADNWFADRFEPDNDDLKDNDPLRQAWQRVANNTDWQNFKKVAVNLKKEVLADRLLDAITGVLDLGNYTEELEDENNVN
ncbi:hypothetical protein [uncultured Lactobacillus sp.]|uniref:hypothetical protein n=1 Tax=uncultured Lactobacillus sp. TaxID=153152 RepID=UPI0025F167FD|nr:hypothetical protein [uncultured Lactobacillus sp.]